MTHRQRILATLSGEMADQLPWARRIDSWHEAHQNMGTLPGKYASWSMYDVFEQAIESFMHQVLEDIRPGDRFILALGDNLPTDGSLERLERISEMVEQLGRLPIC